jgi:hypothetical protein
MRIDPSLIDPGEKLLWSGRPDPVRFALGKSIGTFFFGIPFFAFSLFWIYLALTLAPQDSWGRYFWLFGIPFLLAGAAMLLSPAWMFYCAHHTTYLLTNKRAIIAAGGAKPHRLSVPLAGITAIDACPFSDDHGSIVFKEIIVKSSEGGETVQQEGFIAIPELARVERILRSAIDRSRGATT